MKYPECEKWAKVSVRARAICEFLEWAEGQNGYVLPKPPEEAAMLFYGIDSKKIEEERQEMVAAL